MPNSINSPNMNLPVPVVGVDPGPQYAIDVNSCLSLIDSHDHASGNGVQITPSGLNINADLSIQSHNLTLAKSIRFTAQGSPLSGPSDLGCVYVSGVDLYYNDENGNAVRITQNAALVGPPGNISGLVAPASASYVSSNGTFIWQSAVNRPAYMDMASVILRNFSVNSFGLTLNPPLAMGADYSLTLPALPGSQKFMTLDASGNMSAPWACDSTTTQISANTVKVVSAGIVDNTTVEANSNLIRIKDQGVTAAKIANNTITATQLANNAVGTLQILDGSVTPAKLSTAVYAASATIVNVGTRSTSFSDLGVTATIASTGRPVVVRFIPQISSGNSGRILIEYFGTGGTPAPETGVIRFMDNGVECARFDAFVDRNDDGQPVLVIPSSSCETVYVPSAASHTYTAEIKVTGTVTKISIQNTQLVAYQI